MIQVVVDDLAFVAADAVLRPANERLEPITPAGRRLDEIAGPGFAAQRRVSVPLDAGAAVVTGGGELMAGLVIHLVLQTDDTPVSRETVRRALQAAWQRAADWQLAAVAAPVVGGGPGGLDSEEAMELMVRTLPAGGWPRRVDVVLERDTDREPLAALLRRLGG